MGKKLTLEFFLIHVCSDFVSDTDYEVEFGFLSDRAFWWKPSSFSILKILELNKIVLKNLKLRYVKLKMTNPKKIKSQNRKKC